MLNAVAALAPPGNTCWQGLADRRSAKRFLSLCGGVALANGLDNEGLARYFLMRCVEPDLRDEINDACAEVFSVRPIDYAKVISRIEVYFNERFAYNNGSDRVMKSFQGGSWAKGVKDFEQYSRAFRGIVRDCEVVGLNLDQQVQLQYFVEFLPDRIKEYAEDSLDQGMGLEALEGRITSWVLRKQVNHFRPRTIPAKAVEPEECDEAKAARVRLCFLCKEEGHFARECPKKKEQTTPAAGVGSDDELSWSAVVIANHVSGDPMPGVPVITVKLKSRGALEACKVSALVDSGSSKTLCSQEMAEALHKMGSIKSCDVRGVNELNLRYADGSTGKDIGNIDCVIDGVAIKVHVLKKVSPDLIIGTDLIPRHPGARDKLIAFAKGKDGEEQNAAVQEIPPLPEFKCAASVVMVGLEDDRAAAAHAQWPAIRLNWLSEARPAVTDLSSGFREARALERRLERTGLLEAYQGVIQEWTTNGWLAETPLGEVKNVFRHFAVRKQGGGIPATVMSRCRLVVDGSSLGKFVDPGICSHRDLLANLVLFRACNRFSCIDISSAYMRLQIDERDQAYMVILWREKAFRFTSLPMGINCSASELQACVDAYISDWQSSTNEGAVSQIAPYMDDLLLMTFTSSVDDEIAARNSLVEFLEGRNMKVSVPKLFGSKELEEGAKGKILGVQVEGSNLVLRPSVKQASEDSVLTRKQAVSILSSMYDPLGLASELSLKAREIIRDGSGVAWTKPVPREIVLRVSRWVRLVNSVRIEAPRRLCINTGDPLYVFCDASKIGIGIVVIAPDEEGAWQRLFSRAVLYKKHQREWTGTSAKIELLALQSALHTIQYLTKVLKRIGRLPTWRLGTDSEVNLTRMGSEEVTDGVVDPWQRKVSRLCSNGLNNAKVQVYHVPGVFNPADSVSRGNWSADVGKCYEAAVGHFSEERAFVPEKNTSRELLDEEAICDMVDVDGDEVMHGDALAREEFSDPENTQEPNVERLDLSERYLAERVGDQSKESWFRSYQDSDPAILKLLGKGKLKEVNGVLVQEGRQSLDGFMLPQMIVPKALILSTMRLMHDSAGHLGPDKTAIKALDRYCWRGLRRDIRRYVASCPVCQLVRGRREWRTQPTTLYTDGKPWSTVSCDLVKGEERILLVMVCMYTRFMHVVPLARENAVSVANGLEKVFLKEGACGSLVMDRAQAMMSEEVRALLLRWGIQPRYIPRYAAFFGGWYERQHATLVGTIAKVDPTGARFKKVIDLAVLYANSRPYEFCQVGSSLSPFEVFKGRKAPGFFDRPMDALSPLPVEEHEQENVELIVQELTGIRESFEEIWKSLRHNSFKNMQRMAANIEKLSEGDYVYVHIPKLLQRKYGSRWEGPKLVDKVLTESGTLLLVDGKLEHAFNLKKAFLRNSLGTGQPVHPPFDPPGDHASGLEEAPNESGIDCPSSGHPGIGTDLDGSVRKRKFCRRSATDARKKIRLWSAMVCCGSEKPGGELLLI